MLNSTLVLNSLISLIEDCLLFVSNFPGTSKSIQGRVGEYLGEIMGWIDLFKVLKPSERRKNPKRRQASACMLPLLLCGVGVHPLCECMCVCMSTRPLSSSPCSPLHSLCESRQKAPVVPQTCSAISHFRVFSAGGYPDYLHLEGLSTPFY